MGPVYYTSPLRYQTMYAMWTIGLTQLQQDCRAINIFIILSVNISLRGMWRNLIFTWRYLIQGLVTTNPTFVTILLYISIK